MTKNVYIEKKAAIAYQNIYIKKFYLLGYLTYLVVIATDKR